MTIMMKDHAGWIDFVGRLDFALFVKPCNGTHDHAESILRKVKGVDLQQSIDYFGENGGCCDCEIMFNVVDSDDLADPVTA